MEKINIWALCMTAILISFLGFIVENIWLFTAKGYMDNRSMYLPFLMGYGIAMLLIYFILGTPKKLWFFGKTILIKNWILKYIIYFIGVMICICLGEILLGKLVEKMCHFYWWDYSKIPFHITRYTSIPTSTLFSCGVTIFMDVFLEPICRYFQSWNIQALKIMVITMGLLMMGDFLYNAWQMYKAQSMTRIWKIDMTKSRIYKLIHT